MSFVGVFLTGTGAVRHYRRRELGVIMLQGCCCSDVDAWWVYSMLANVMPVRAAKLSLRFKYDGLDLFLKVFEMYDTGVV